MHAPYTLAAQCELFCGHGLTVKTVHRRFFEDYKKNENKEVRLRAGRHGDARCFAPPCIPSETDLTSPAADRSAVQRCRWCSQLALQRSSA